MHLQKLLRMFLKFLRERQEDQDFWGILGYMRPCLEKEEKKFQKD